jgi:hypothetical protein
MTPSRPLRAPRRGSLLAGQEALRIWLEKPFLRPRCATGCIANAIGALKPGFREPWVRLFEMTDLHRRSRPTDQWVEDSQPWIDLIGRAVFQVRVTHWLQSIADVEPAYLTRLGSHVLKSLVWWASAVPSPHLDAAVLRLASIDWTPAVRRERIRRAVAFAVAQMDETTQTPGLLRIRRPEGGYLWLPI